MTRMLTICFVVLTTAHQRARAFNLDPENAQVFHGPSGSYFGYAVAQYFENGQPWVLAGAPLSHEADVGNVNRSGAVYRCPVHDSGRSCEVILIDPNGQTEQEQKSFRWLGATLATADNMIVACAPHYVYKMKNLEARLSIGACYLYRRGQEVQTITPVKKDCDNYYYEDNMVQLDQYDRYGLSQVGFSAEINKDATLLVIGAVGALNWQGVPFTETLDGSRPTSHRNGLMESSLSHNRYLGYSTCIGDFDGDGVEDFAFGMPRAWSLKGRVRLVSEDLSTMYHRHGGQLGEYFGASVAAGDFNGDGKVDLVAGAPHYGHKGNGTAIEIGRVYVFYHEGSAFNRHWTYLDDPTVPHLTNGARFGAALAALGDINDDGFDDLAVAAPYGGDDKRGAVYIFVGSSRGLFKQPAQIINGASVDPTLKGFGFSLAGGKDLDNNTYADLVVGALDSDAAVFIRAKPVIRMQATMTFDTPIIKLRERLCETSSGLKVVCLVFTTCFNYTGKEVPQEIVISATWKLDVVKGRVQYLNGTCPEHSTCNTPFINLTKMEKYCVTSHAFVQNNIRDKLSPIVVELEYSLYSKRGIEGPQPILDQYIPSQTSHEAKIWRDCGEDDTCTADLVLEATSKMTSYIIGSPDVIQLNISVSNQGEDAFDAFVKTGLPNGVSYLNRRIIEAVMAWHKAGNKPLPEPILTKIGVIIDHVVLTTSDIKCHVLTDETTENDYISCGIGNPLASGAKTRFLLTLSARDFDGYTNVLRFQIEASSHHPENATDEADNEATIEIPVSVVAEIQLSGVTEPDEIFFNSTTPEQKPLMSVDQFGPEVMFRYEIQNRGPSAVSHVTFEVNWPSYFNGPSGTLEDLLYITMIRKIQEGDEGEERLCAATVNYRDLQVNSIEPRAVEDEAPATRHKRAIGDFIEVKNEQSFDCFERTELCTDITCQTGRLEGGDTAVVEVRARLAVQTLIKAEIMSLIVSSRAVARVTGVPYKLSPDEYSTAVKQVSLRIHAIETEKKIALWIIIISALAGVLILILVFVILWRCGFFKRQTQMDMEKICDMREARRSMRVRESLKIPDNLVIPAPENGEKRTSKASAPASPPPAEKEKMNVILIGSINCESLKLSGDDHVTLSVTKLIDEELRLSEAIKLLESCPDDIKEASQAVVLHAGGYDFPVVDFVGMDQNLADYKKLIKLASESCPNAKVILSSVLPRLGKDSGLVNQQVSHFNNSLSTFSGNEGMVFQDNDLHFEDSRGVMAVLYDKEDPKGMLLNDNGREKLEITFLTALKDVLFKSKLHQEWA